MSAVNPLSAEFLYELYATALRQEPLCAVLARHMRKEYLPDRSFQQVQEAIAVHFKTYKTPPSRGGRGTLGRPSCVPLLHPVSGCAQCRT